MSDWISHSICRKLGTESHQGCWDTVSIPINTDFLEGFVRATQTSGSLGLHAQSPDAKKLWHQQGKL